MTHSSRTQAQASQISLPEFYLESQFFEQQTSVYAAKDVIEQIVLNGAQILHMKYLQSQIKPYASRTLAKELIMNASWALEPLGPNDITAEPDEDLEIPCIDEWAGGVLPVRSPDAVGLRNAVTPARDVRKTTTSTHRQRQPEQQQSQRSETSARSNATTTTATVRNRETNRNKENTKKKARPPVTEAAAITKAFEDARKKSSVTMKSITVDSDLNVIQISEPHSLPPALIVPKVQVKKQSKQTEAVSIIPRAPRAVIKKPEPQKRRPQQKLLEPDTPIFDEDIADISLSEKFVCSPGVTFKDGTITKSRPSQSNANHLTRAQYEAYLEDMKRSTDGDTPRSKAK